MPDDTINNNASLSSKIQNQIITEKEQKMYDRQIRVWGLEAQKRIRLSKVLIIGSGALLAETCKNLTLAGIGRIDFVTTKLQKSLLIDDELIKRVFCYSENDRGQRSDKILAKFLKELNPNVKICVEETSLENLEDDFYSKYDIFCVFETHLKVELKINKIARKYKKYFFSGDVMGKNGLCFTDLGDEFKYVKNDKENILKFCSLENSLKSKNSCFRKRQFKEEMLFDLIKSVYIYEQRYKYLPSLKSKNDFLDILNTFQHPNFPILTDKTNFINNFLQSLKTYSLPISAIIGGILGQEIIKSICQNSQPFINWLFFSDLLDGSAVIINIQ